jgi:DNA-binding MarR family transcriptional regulator
MGTGMIPSPFGSICQPDKKSGFMICLTPIFVILLGKLTSLPLLFDMTNSRNKELLASDLRTVITRLIKKLRDKSTSSGKLSLTERSTIALLDHHQELLPSELAVMEKITNQSMSQILNHLHGLGYIIRKRSAADKRKVIISLSKAGQDILHKVRHERDEWLNGALNKICTIKEQEMLRRAITPLTKLVDFD